MFYEFRGPPGETCVWPIIKTRAASCPVRLEVLAGTPQEEAVRIAKGLVAFLEEYPRWDSLERTAERFVSAE